MKVIDLLNKIANGEEVPNRIKYKNCIFENKCVIEYWCKEIETCLDELILMQNLNDEVEILEEENKFTKEDFIKEAMDLEGLTREEFNKIYEVKECNCGREFCKGFIKVEKVEEVMKESGKREIQRSGAISQSAVAFVKSIQTQTKILELSGKYNVEVKTMNEFLGIKSNE